MKNNIEVIFSAGDAPVDESGIQDLLNWILADQKSGVPWRINLIFVDDEFISELNERFLQKSGPTDVISFNLTDSSEQPEGEIYISLDTAARNAADYGVKLVDELCRLTAHGVYHLLDFDDETPEQREEMTRLENKALEYIQSTL